MNKYSKRALKTTATVGMSLAMVLSGVAAPVSAATTKPVCELATGGYTEGQAIASKKIDKKIGAADGFVADFNKKELTKVIDVEGIKVETTLRYVLAANTNQKVAANGSIVSGVLIDGTTYGYYATATNVGTYTSPITHRTITIAEHDLISADTTITTAIINGFERAESVVTTEITAAAAEVPTKTVINAKGETVNVTTKVVYEQDGTAVELASIDKTKDTIVKHVADGEFKNYTCTNVTTANGIVIESLNHANNVYKGIVTSFDKAESTLDTIKLTEKVNFEEASSTAELGKEVTILTGTLANTTIDIDFAATLKNLSKVINSDSDEGKAIERFLGIEKAMNNMFKDGGSLDIATDGYNDRTELNSRTYKAAVDLLKEFTDFDTYLTNLTETDADRVIDKRDLLEELVTAYIAENDGDMIDIYLTQLEKFYDQFVENEGVNGITKADVDKAIRDIKKGATFTSLKNEPITMLETDYLAFKDIDGVVDYVTKFEDMYEEIAAVKEATSKSNDAYKALIKGGSDSVRSFLKGKVAADDTFSKIYDDISIEDYKILKAYKEEVLDVLMTMEAKEVGNTFVNKSTKSIYATTAQLRDALLNVSNKEVTPEGITNKKGVFTELDREEGVFNWDKLVAHMDKVVESHELLTKGIAKLDPITLVASDRATILAADDAVYFLEVGGDGAGNLTSSEARDVRNAQRKVNELLEAYRVKFGSISEISGWENKGNGDWAYYENGNAVTKWVAAGSDWYYVSNGLMLRNSWIAENASGARWYYVDDAGKMVSNTTIGGYAIDANGIWTK